MGGDCKITAEDYLKWMLKRVSYEFPSQEPAAEAAVEKILAERDFLTQLVTKLESDLAQAESRLKVATDVITTLVYYKTSGKVYISDESLLGAIGRVTLHCQRDPANQRSEYWVERT